MRKIENKLAGWKRPQGLVLEQEEEEEEEEEDNDDDEARLTLMFLSLISFFSYNDVTSLRMRTTIAQRSVALNRVLSVLN
jgi:hypothetical protein